LKEECCRIAETNNLITEDALMHLVITVSKNVNAEPVYPHYIPGINNSSPDSKPLLSFISIIIFSYQKNTSMTLIAS